MLFSNKGRFIINARGEFEKVDLSKGGLGDLPQQFWKKLSYLVDSGAF